MEVGVKWKFGNGNMYNGSVQWMTLPSHRIHVYQLNTGSCHCIIKFAFCYSYMQVHYHTNLCATVITVLSVNSLLIVCWIWESVWRSTLAVASSMQMTLACVRRALARQSSCLWPTENTLPFSCTSAPKPPIPSHRS